MRQMTFVLKSEGVLSSWYKLQVGQVTAKQLTRPKILNKGQRRKVIYHAASAGSVQGYERRVHSRKTKTSAVTVLNSFFSHVQPAHFCQMSLSLWALFNFQRKILAWGVFFWGLKVCLLVLWIGVDSGHLVLWGFKTTLEEERTQEKALGETFWGSM